MSNNKQALAIVQKPALSNTQLNMLSRCGEQYRRRYIEGERIPPGVAMIVGSSTDESINQNLTHKIETSEMLSPEAVADIARDALEARWESGVLLSDEEVEQGMKKVKGEAVDKSIRLSLLHRMEKAPSLSATHVQRPWRIELEGYPMDLIGYIDIQEGTSSVRDTKTSQKSPTKTIADTDNQLTLYAMAASVLDGKPPEKVALDYLVDLKTPKTVTCESTRTVDDFKVMLRRIEVAIEAIEKGVFVPANENDWWCSKKWCGYWDSCPFAKRPRSVSLTNIES